MDKQRDSPNSKPNVKEEKGEAQKDVSELMGALTVAERTQGAGTSSKVPAVLGHGGTVLVYDQTMMKHKAEGDHPECPERILEIWKELGARGLVNKCRTLQPRLARVSEVELVHEAALCETLMEVKEKAAASELYDVARSYNSVFLNSHSVNCALMAAGSVLAVVEQVVTGTAQNGACVVRPPGHHAEAARCMGFCLLNSVAIAARLARTALQVPKVLILDWDVHHGNGTQEAFQSDPNVLMVSIHRYERGSFYPGCPEGDSDFTGEGEGTGYTLNVAWNHRDEDEDGNVLPREKSQPVGDADYLLAFKELVMPVCRAFNPDLVLVSAGFDAAEGDPLGGCKVTPRGFAHMTQMLKTLADGKIVLCLEGGYNLGATARSFADCVEVLVGQELPPWEGAGKPTDAGCRAVEASRSKHSKHWGVLVG